MTMSKQCYKRVRRALSLEVCRKPLDAFAWPGGYPLYYLTYDNAVLCPACVNAEIVRVDAEIKSQDRNDQFRVVGADVNYEDTSLFCDNCDKLIESAYGEE
jgi:hypothetical protein